MTTFYVGQRVRIVGPSNAGLTGREAVIISNNRANHWRYGWGTYYQVCVDGYGQFDSSGTQLSYPSHAIEPLTPSGHQPAELSVDELLPFLKERVQA